MLLLAGSGRGSTLCGSVDECTTRLPGVPAVCPMAQALAAVSQVRRLLGGGKGEQQESSVTLKSQPSALASFGSHSTSRNRHLFRHCYSMSCLRAALSQWRAATKQEPVQWQELPVSMSSLPARGAQIVHGTSLFHQHGPVMNRNLCITVLRAACAGGWPQQQLTPGLFLAMLQV
jgi:hypothetical protein